MSNRDYMQTMIHWSMLNPKKDSEESKERINLKKLIIQDLVISSNFTNNDEEDFPYIVNVKEQFVVSTNINKLNNFIY